MKRLLIVILMLCSSAVCLADRGELPMIVKTAAPSKKGVAGPGGCQVMPDLPILMSDLGVSWFFTWNACPWTDWAPFGIEYVPMARKSVDVATVALFPSGSYWLVGNEPDNKAQDDLTPAEAADQYGKIVYAIISVDPDAKVILGGFTNLSQYTHDGYRAQLELAWMTRWNRSIRDVITGWHGHVYSYQYGDETLQQAFWRLRRRVEHWIEDEPDMELWVTEFGNLRFADVQTLEWLTEFLEDTAGVTRYAFFYFGSPPPIDEEWRFTSCYVWPDLQMTELGRTYARLPSIPTITPEPTSTATNTPTSTPASAPISTNTPVSDAPGKIIFIEPRLDMTASPDPVERDMQKTWAFITLVNHVRTLVIGILLLTGALSGVDLIVKWKKS